MSEDHPSQMLIARLLLGQASAAEVQHIERHARTCAPCRAELDGAQAARARFVDEVLPRTLPRLEQRLAPRPRSWLAALGLATALAGATALALLVVRPGHPAPPEEPAYGVKGTGALRLYGRRDGHVFPVEAATVLRPGDQLGFAVQAAGARHVLIASIDGRGQANIYCPSTPLAADAGVAWTRVGDSIVLDDAPGRERVFAIFSAERLADAAILPALRAAAAGGQAAVQELAQLPLPYAQASVSFEKSPGGLR